MRSMVEGHSDSVSPSTALRAVPLPIRYADSEDWKEGGLRGLATSPARAYRPPLVCRI
jgi:hypothetical protein